LIERETKDKRNEMYLEGFMSKTQNKKSCRISKSFQNEVNANGKRADSATKKSDKNVLLAICSYF